MLHFTLKAVATIWLNIFEYSACQKLYISIQRKELNVWRVARTSSSHLYLPDRLCVTVQAKHLKTINNGLEAHAFYLRWLIITCAEQIKSQETLKTIFENVNLYALRRVFCQRTGNIWVNVICTDSNYFSHLKGNNIGCEQNYKSIKNNSDNVYAPFRLTITIKNNFYRSSYETNCTESWNLVLTVLYSVLFYLKSQFYFFLFFFISSRYRGPGGGSDVIKGRGRSSICVKTGSDIARDDSAICEDVEESQSTLKDVK